MALPALLTAYAEQIDKLRIDGLFGSGAAYNEVADAVDEARIPEVTSHYLLALCALETARQHMKLAVAFADKGGA